MHRESQKGRSVDSPGSPGAGDTAKPGKHVGTQRKCANCGMIGHIKTNKKLCPLLNGTMKQEDGFAEQGFSTAKPSI